MKLKLKLKKFFAALVTGFMAVSMLAGIPSSCRNPFILYGWKFQWNITNIRKNVT